MRVRGRTNINCVNYPMCVSVTQQCHTLSHPHTLPVTQPSACHVKLFGSGVLRDKLFSLHLIQWWSHLTPAHTGQDTRLLHIWTKENSGQYLNYPVCCVVQYQGCWDFLPNKNYNMKWNKEFYYAIFVTHQVSLASWLSTIFSDCFYQLRLTKVPEVWSIQETCSVIPGLNWHHWAIAVKMLQN